MKLPIQYAMAYPDRISNDFPRYDFTKSATLTFEPPDIKTFRNLSLATDAMFKGGNAPAVLNAANEIAVAAFLDEGMPYLQIPKVVEKTLNAIHVSSVDSLEVILDIDAQARRAARDFIKAIQ